MSVVTVSGDDPSPQSITVSTLPVIGRVTVSDAPVVRITKVKAGALIAPPPPSRQGLSALLMDKDRALRIA